MDKYYIIGIAAAAITVCTTTAIIVASHINKRSKLVDELFQIRDDLKNDCDIIKDAQEEIPAAVTCPADQKFISVANKALEFANTTIPLYTRLDEDMSKLDIEELKTNIESFKEALATAEMYTTAIDAARKDMADSRKNPSNL